jgi:Rnl2 family RNA ligase
MFYKYQKIYDNLDNYILDKKTNNKLFSKKVKWIVQEKIHGSNFSIYYDGKECQFAKRNSILKNNDWFYNYQIIKNKLINNTKKLYNLLNKDKIIIYGELFGGFYPDNVSEWKNNRIDNKGLCKLSFDERAIQEGIYYSKNIEYIVFDIAYEDNNNIHFLNYFETNNYIKKTEFLFSEALAITDLSSALNFNLNFNTKIPNKLGYESFPEFTNLAEGIVIKPSQTIILKNKKNKDVRCLIKKKNKKFKEISDTFNLEEAKKSYKFTFINMLNINRINAVISKIGKINKENLIEKLVEDIWNDYYINYNFKISDYDKANIYLNKICKNFVNETYIN